MIAIELACIAIVALYVVVRLALTADRGPFLRRLALMAIGAWVGENTVIHAYHFYTYSPRWHLFVDQVPLMILLIWPVVIHSAWDVIGHLCRKSASVTIIAVATALVVLADASLIEPIAVASELWWWHEPGLFEAPPIGLLGWSYFALLCVAIFERNRRAGAPALADALAVIAPAAGVHLMLLATWWGGLRWVNGTVEPNAVLVVIWPLSIALAAVAWKRDARRRVPLNQMLLRIPGALFFFALLAIYGRDNWALVVYALAFAPPYLALTQFSSKAPPVGVTD